MPKKANPKKMAAQQLSKIVAVEAAIAEGKYLSAKIIKSIGNCSFEAKLQTADGRLVDCKVLVRGKMKCGVNGATRIEKDCYVLVENSDPKKLMEVVGVVNRQTELDRLRRGGRVSRQLDDVGEGAGGNLDDLFDRGEEGEEEGAAMAGDGFGRRDEEREEQAREFLERYLKKRAGQKYAREHVVERGVFGAEERDIGGAGDAERDEAAELAEMAEGLGAAAGGGAASAKKPVTSARRLRAMLINAGELPPEEREAEEARVAALWEQQQREEAAREAEEERVAAEFAALSKKAAEVDDWEALIDAI
jgi:hypothetical protein